MGLMCKSQRLRACRNVNLMSAEVENQAWGHKPDDTTYADIRQEVLRKVDARIGAQCSKHKE